MLAKSEAHLGVPPQAEHLRSFGEITSILIRHRPSGGRGGNPHRFVHSSVCKPEAMHKEGRKEGTEMAISGIGKIHIDSREKAASKCRERGFQAQGTQTNNATYKGLQEW